MDTQYPLSPSLRISKDIDNLVEEEERTMADTAKRCDTCNEVSDTIKARPYGSTVCDVCYADALAYAGGVPAGCGG